MRAAALMNLGTAEAWTLGTPDAPDAERHLREGADLARKIGRPYLEVGCLAQLGFASLVLHSVVTTQRRCREAIALAERYGLGADPVIAPASIMLAGTMIWTGEFDEGERWLRRTRQALQTDSGPDITLLLHQTAGICTLVAAVTMKHSRSSVRPNTWDRSWRTRRRWRPGPPAGCWPPRPASG